MTQKLDTDRCKGILAIRSAIPVVEAAEELDGSQHREDGDTHDLITIESLDALRTALATYRKAVAS